MRGDFDTLDMMFEERPDKTRAPSKPGALLGFLLACVAGGLCMALLVAPVIIPIVAAPAVASDHWGNLPSDLPEVALPQRSVLLDSQGKQIAVLFSENRVTTSLDKVSPHVVDALLSTEDSRFYEHNGVDWMGVARAVRSNALSDSTQGASTITQQLVKNTLILAATTEEGREAAKEVSMKRKMEEIRYAVALEERWSKDEILERYLNTVLFSNAVYGIETAARYYFSVSAKDLSLAQSAMLVGLLKNPSSYDPVKSPENALGRRAVVLARMVATGDITKAQAEKADREPLGLKLKKERSGCSVSKYPFYCQWVVDSLKDDPRLGDTADERETRIYLGGMRITTALDTTTQGRVQKVVDDALGRDNRVATGVALVEPGTGHVSALAQNRSWGQGTLKNGDKATEIVLPATAGYQPGSAFKPITLAAALESGFPADATLNAPAVFNPGDMNVPAGGITNSGSGGVGRLTINDATAVSSNTYYASLQREVGVLTVAEMARNLGLEVPDTLGARDASFTLGVTSASPLQLSAAYAAFVANGLYCAPTGVLNIRDAQGRELVTEKSRCHQAMSAATAGTVVKALRSVIDGPLKNRTGILADLNRPAGGKTGTTNSHSAAWFAGITPQYASAVWMGDPRGGFKYPLTGGIRYKGSWVYNVYASKIAAPLWRDVMLSALKDKKKVNFDISDRGVLSGASVVPNVQGMTVEAAVATLTSQGFKATLTSKNAKADKAWSPGLVYRQNPEPGSRVFNASVTTVELQLTAKSPLPTTSR